MDLGHTMTMCVNIATRNTQNTGNTWDIFEKVIITCQGRNHGDNLGSTSAMVGRICPPWLG